MTIIVNGASSALGGGPFNTSALGPWNETSWWAPNTVAINDGSRGTRRVTLVDDPLGVQSGKVFRAELLATDGAAITSLPTSRRSELSAYATFQGIGQTWWYRVRTLLPADWVVDTAGQSDTCFWQVHDLPDAGDPGRGPPLEFIIIGSNMVIQSRAPVTAGNDASGSRLRNIIVEPISSILGKWQEWVVRATLDSTDSTGALTIWQNRRRIFEETGERNCYNDVGGLYPACGTYCPVGWPVAGVSSRVTYNTGVVVGDSSETFLSFTGASELERVQPVRLAVV